jgi:hypothetical protein
VDPCNAPTGTSIEEWENLDQKERSTIWLCLLVSILLSVSGDATTKEIWNELGDLY